MPSTRIAHAIDYPMTTAERQAEEVQEREQLRQALLEKQGLTEDTVDPAVYTALVQSTPGAMFPIFTEAQLLAYKMPPQLVDDVILQQTTVAFVSHPGVGKSFVALDLALCIASGQETFLDKPLRQEGAVVYIIGEGHGRFNLRVKVWRQEHGIAEGRELPFYSTDGPVNLMDKDVVKSFIEAIKPLSPKLVVFDTLSRCTVGEAENESATMSTVVEHLDMVKHETKATILVLHHLNANGNKARGHTSFKGAVDTELTFIADPKDDTILVTSNPGKQKDLDDGDVAVLRKMVYDVEGVVEASGQPARSCVFVSLTAEARQKAAHEGMVNKRTQRNAVLAKATANPGIHKGELATLVGGRRTTTLELIDEMVNDEELTATEETGRGGQATAINLGPMKRKGLHMVKR